MIDIKQGNSNFNLTASQQSMFLGQKLQPNDPLYNMTMCFTILGPIDVDVFRRSFQQVVNSSDVMRAVIVDSGNEYQTATQDVKAQFSYLVEFIDFSSELEPETSYQHWLNKRKLNNFDLADILFDSVLIKLSSQKFVWFFNQHHLNTDAWSMGLLYDRMQSIYNQLAQKNDNVVSHLSFPDFQQFALVDEQQKSSNRFQRAKKFWQKSKEVPFNPTQFYHPTPLNRSAKTQRFNCQFGKSRSDKLRSIAKQQLVSFSEDLSVMQIFSTLLFSYLNRISGNSQLSIGTPVHSRTSEKLKNTAGLLINLFPLKISIDNDDTFISLYHKVAKANQQLLIHAVSGASTEILGRAFDVVLNYIPSAFGSFAGIPATTEWIDCEHTDRDHVLRMHVYDFEKSGEFTVCFDINLDVFNQQESEWVCEHFLALTDAFLADQNSDVSATPLITIPTLPYQNTQDKLLTSTFRNIADLIAEQACQTPLSTALVDRNCSLNYLQLDKQSTRIASQLKQLGVTLGDVVGIKIQRSIEAVTAILGVMKSGATFLPIDSAHPSARIQFILDDSAVKCVLVDDLEYANWNFNQPAFGLNQLPDTAEVDLPSISSQDIAYIIYTSGSTGQPKGVLVTHTGLSNYIQWASDYYLDGHKLVFPLFSSLSFDLTITSLFVPLVSGGKLIVYRDDQTEAGMTIRAVIEDNQVDVIKLTPAHLTLIQSMDFSTSRLKKLVVGGDDFKTELAANIDRFFAGQIDIFNEYGPTEATVACTVHKYNSTQDNSVSVPIGKPIKNTNIYILDRHLNAVPQGVTGEIYISGQGLASGYLNQPETTAIRFIKNPFKTDELLYKTGDLGSFNRRSEIQYLGRNDQQIKVHGIRIETAEIESALLKFNGISDAVVDLSEHLSHEVQSDPLQHCITCGLEASHPSAQLDESHTCRLCRIFQKQHQQALSYFRTPNDLNNWVAKIKQQAKSNTQCQQDVIMLLSGGKDSSYALCKLVDMGLTPLVFTLDNGFISEGAKANCQRLVDRLGLELVEASTPDMNDIFVDSLTRFSNVCNGCFKTIYTLSMNLAKERGIKVICTGLSRGQIFETRVAHLFQQGCFDPDEIDKQIIEARKSYHRTKDLVSNRLDVKVFDDDSVFADIEYLDFYRYMDVTLDEMYDYLNNVAPWIRPSDTGRSTNCLINDAGIYVHKKERGYHNYSLPYSWDVRLGHKERNAALEELDDEIDIVKVEKILEKIGYQSEDVNPDQYRRTSLIGYYVAPAEILKNSLQKHLAKTLPKEYIPNQFVWMSSIPLTQNGKVDRGALPLPRLSRRDLSVDYSTPIKESEIVIALLWQQILGVEEVGIDDNFFDLGGDSIVNIQIVSAARSKGIEITPQQIFDYPTIRQLASVATTTKQTLAAQGELNGSVALLPSQSRYFQAIPATPNQFNQSVLLDYDGEISTDLLLQAFTKLIDHHDGLRAKFEQTAEGWHQIVLSNKELLTPNGIEIDLSATSDALLDVEIENCKHELLQQLDISNGKLVCFANILTPEGIKNRLLIVIHHLVCDGVSWWVLLGDLNRLIDSHEKQHKISLPEKTCSIKQWRDSLTAFADKYLEAQERSYWQQLDQAEGDLLSCENKAEFEQTEFNQTIKIDIDSIKTKQLLTELPKTMSIAIQDVLLTALVHSVMESFPTNKLKIDIEGHGRQEVVSGISIMRTLGWFTNTFPLLVSRENLELNGKDLKIIKEQVKKVPHHGIGYGALGLNKSSQLLFNYMGQWDKNLSDDSHFSFIHPITKSHDKTQSSHIIEFNGMVYNHCLQVELTFNKSIFDEGTMLKVESAFVRSLASLIDYGLSGKELGYTPSDFPTAEIGQEELDDIFDEFGDDD